MVTPDSHLDVTQVNPAATGGQNSVLPWEISVFLGTILSRAPATGTDEGGEVSRGHIRRGIFALKGRIWKSRSSLRQFDECEAAARHG